MAVNRTRPMRTVNDGTASRRCHRCARSPLGLKEKVVLGPPEVGSLVVSVGSVYSSILVVLQPSIVREFRGQSGCRRSTERWLFL